MWFTKWFGGRKDDSEPSEHPPHPLAMGQKAAPNCVRPATNKPDSAKKKGSVKGFDPYNSGSFDKNKAWERVIR